MPRPRDQRGTALPVTLFIVAIVTIMLSALFVRVQADRRIADSSSDNVDALAIAKSGLDRYLGDVNFDYCLRPIRPSDGDSVRVNTTGGYADVVARVVRRPADTLATWMYVVRSTGRVIHPSAGSEPQAVRTVAQFAEWHPAHITVPAAFTAANGLVRDAGGDGEFKGQDQASPSSCRLPDIHAIRTPNGGAPSSTSGFNFNGRWPYVLADASADHVVDTTGIGWATLYNGDLEADYDYVKPGDTSYPFMYIDGDHTLDADNTWVYGTLVVTGDLTITGGRLQWYGVVLVGGVIDFNSADQRFDGAVFTGLNERLGLNPPKGAIGGMIYYADKYLDIDYDSDEIRKALNRFAGFAPVSNGWVDNWATY